MTKPFDFAELGNRLLKDGMPAAEAIAKVAAKEVFSWLKDSLVLEAVKQPLFAIAIPVLAAIEPIVMAELEKIAP